MADRDDNILIAAAIGVLGLASVVTLLKKTNEKGAPRSTILDFGLIGPSRPASANDFSFPLPERKPRVVPQGFDAIYQKYGRLYGVDWRLLKAIAVVESSERSQAKNPADPSYGLMQVLCVTPGGASGARCTNRFNIVGWDQATPDRLFDPGFNVKMATQILKWNLDTYGFLKGIAVYNRWASRNDPKNGPFGNQGYVDKVLAAYRSVGGTIGSSVSL